MRKLFLLAAAVTVLPIGLSAQDSKPLPDVLDESTTRSLVAKYKETDHWALRCIILSALGRGWHPCAAEILLDAFRNSDRRLRAYAAETLLRADPEALRAAATKEVVDEIVRNQLGQKNPLYRERLLKALQTIAPDAGAADADDWQRWWMKAREAYAPPPWKAPPAEPGEPKPADGSGKTVAEEFVRRAFDLGAFGLDMTICLDTTGSMQPTIDAAKAGLADIVAILRGIAPKFRLGLIQYKDFEDFKEGARILVPLADNVDAVQAQLSKLTAYGGGDKPERIEKALELAVGPAPGWKAEANKLVIVIGDAPPHPETVDACNKIAKASREKPLGKLPSVETGVKPAKGSARPFVVSTIGVGKTAIDPETESSFKGIAEAGGGAYGTLLTEGGRGGEVAGEKIVEQILKLSFGEQWERSTEAFVRIYLEYRKAGFFR